MHKTLAGYDTLQSMIERQIASSRSKLAAAEGKDDEKENGKKPNPFVKRLKKEFVEGEGKEEKPEKKASIFGSFDPHDPEHVSKLASALEIHSNQLVKEADSVTTGGETASKAGLMPTGTPLTGTQAVDKKKALGKFIPPGNPKLIRAAENGPAATAIDTNLANAPAGGRFSPAKGYFKTASSQVRDLIAAKQVGGKENPAIFIIEKLGAGGAAGERAMGGDTGDSGSEDGPKPPTGGGPSGANADRRFIGSIGAAINLKKREAKASEKRSLRQVLTEPAHSAAHDGVVQANLRNASKGGVKIAANMTLLQKIAEEGCTCGGKGECRYCKLKEAKAMMDKKSANPSSQTAQ